MPIPQFRRQMRASRGPQRASHGRYRWISWLCGFVGPQAETEEEMTEAIILVCIVLMMFGFAGVGLPRRKP